MTERVVAPATAAAACLLVLLALALQADPLSPQSLANRHFAETAGHATALAELNPAWPPLYPSALWAFRSLHVPLAAVNAGLLLATLALLVPVTRRVAPGVHPAWAVALYAAGSFHAFNLHQLVSEALLIPLALCALLFALRARERDSLPDRAALCGVLAAACLTRYFALVWLLPVFGLALWLRAPAGDDAPPARRAARATGIVFLAALPVAAWMLHARVTTGYLTGMDRFAGRGFGDKTTPAANLLLTARTLFLDWLVPGRDASHMAVGPAWSLHPVGLVIAAAAFALAIRCAVAALRATAEAATPQRPPEGLLGFLLPALSVGYLVVLVAVWTVGNNDPIYSRFLYPCYVFFVLAGFHVYAQVKRRHPPSAHGHAGTLLPFRALYALMLVSLAAGSTISSVRAWWAVT